MSLLSPYVVLLRRPHVARLNAAALLAGLPFGMRPLSIVLFARSATGSYGSASVVAAGVAVGAAFLSPSRGRAVDRRGAGRVLPAVAVGHTIALGGLIAAGLAHAPVALLVLLAVAVGGVWPPVGTTLRTLLLDGLAGDDMDLAMSMQALLNEIFFFTGPLIAALLIAVGSAALALGFMGASVLIGTLLFASVEPVRNHRGVPAPGGRWSVLAQPGVRTLIVVMGAWGVAFGGLDVALPAFADAHGAATVGGLLLASLSVGVAVGSVLFAARPSSASTGRRYVAACALGAAGMAPAALATDSWQLVPLCLLIGLAVAPATVLGFVIIGDVTTAATRTEGSSWMASGVLVGSALGAALVGLVVDGPGPRAALLVPCAATLVGFAVVLVRRGTLAAGAVV
jgi:predicted MFS family arabinose efflux permease